MRQIRKIVSITFLIMMSSLLPMTLMADDASFGVINGRVLNETLSHTGLDGLEVILQAYVEGKEPVERRSKTDRNGFFSFQGISTDQKFFYHISTRYKDIEYFGRAIQFMGENALSVDLSVYETTDQDNDIYIKMNHMFFEKDKDSIWIKEALIVENRGNRVYVGSQELQPGRKETLRVSLPEGASNLQFEQHVDPFVVRTAKGFIDTADIKPGNKRILFSYTVGTADLNYKFIKSLHHKTDSFIVIFPEKGVKVKSDQLEFKGPMMNSGQQFFHLSGTNFDKGSRIAIELVSAENKGFFQWVIVGMLILLAGIVFALPFIKQKNFNQEADRQTPVCEEMDLTDQRQVVLRAIAQLDDHAESGGIHMDAYHMERAELLIKAKKLTWQMKNDA